MLAEFWARARNLLDTCDQVLVPIGEDRAHDTDPCHQCGGTPDVRVSMRRGELEMIWVNSCTACQQAMPPPSAPPALP